MSYEAANRTIEIAVTGDSLITRHLSVYREPDFLAIRDLLRGADAAFANLEVVLGEAPGYPAEHAGGNWLGVPPSIADELSWLGFNLFSTANNHGGDFGTAGVLSTLRELAARHLVHAGAGENLARARQPGYLDLPGARVALIGVSSSLPHGSAAGEQRQDMPGRPGVNPLRHDITYRIRPETMTALKAVAEEAGIAAARAERANYSRPKPDAEGEYTLLEGARFAVSDTPGLTSKPNEKDLKAILQWVRDAKRQADLCFVSLHAHEAQVQITRPAQFAETFARACIDAGADAVFGHGPHILRGIELYAGKPIFYSLGNFMMQSSTMQRVPVAMYDRYDLDPFHSTVADIWDARLQKEIIRQNRIYYESLLVRMSIAGGRATSIKLYPLHLGTDATRPQQGRPLLAHGDMAAKILGDIQRLSEPYGTRIAVEGEAGVVQLT